MPTASAADLATITPERLRRALWRSFLRYGVGGEPDTAVHAAMHVIEPVLAARDAEISRLRESHGRLKRPGSTRSGAGTELAGSGRDDGADGGGRASRTGRRQARRTAPALAGKAGPARATSRRLRTAP